MKVKNDFVLRCIFVVWGVLLYFTAARATSTYAIVNCKIVPVSGFPVDKGVIIIRDGIIESLGPKEKISIPEDAEIIEAGSLTAYPGLIDSYTNFFLELPEEENKEKVEIGIEPLKKEHALYPGVMAFELLKIKKSIIECNHRIGVTTVLVAPKKGIFAGQSVLLNLNGEKVEQMVIKNPFALHLNFVTAKGMYPTTVGGTVALLMQSFLDAEYYHSFISSFASGYKRAKRPEYNSFLEALLPFIVEKKPVVFTCNNQEDIKRALRLIDEFKLNAFLCGANEAWRVIGFLKKAKVPLLVCLNFVPPSTSIYYYQGKELRKRAEEEIYPANAAVLYKAGIKFAITSYGLADAESFVTNIRKAVNAGLPREEALKALTITPAQFLGVSDIMGSLEPGKIANIVLTSGEIFEKNSYVEKVFVDGILFEIKESSKNKNLQF